MTIETKRKVSFDRSFAVCCGQSLISPEFPVGRSILITDIESELSDATNANNHVKFKWKPLRKQVPFTVPRLHNIFNQVYNNTFD